MFTNISKVTSKHDIADPFDVIGILIYIYERRGIAKLQSRNQMIWVNPAQVVSATVGIQEHVFRPSVWRHFVVCQFLGDVALLSCREVEAWPSILVFTQKRLACKLSLYQHTLPLTITHEELTRNNRMPTPLHIPLRIHRPIQLILHENTPMLTIPRPSQRTPPCIRLRYRLILSHRLTPTNIHPVLIRKRGVAPLPRRNPATTPTQLQRRIRNIQRPKPIQIVRLSSDEATRHIHVRHLPHIHRILVRLEHHTVETGITEPGTQRQTRPRALRRKIVRDIQIVRLEIRTTQRRLRRDRIPTRPATRKRTLQITGNGQSSRVAIVRVRRHARAVVISGGPGNVREVSGEVVGVCGFAEEGGSAYARDVDLFDIDAGVNDYDAG